jgi:hypothetical protein
MKIPQRHGAGFDPPIIFCACSMQNTPGGFEIPQNVFLGLFDVTSQNVFLGLFDVTSPYKNLVKNWKK